MKQKLTNLQNRYEKDIDKFMKQIGTNLGTEQIWTNLLNIYAQIYETGIDRYMKQILTNL